MKGEMQETKFQGKKEKRKENKEGKGNINKERQKEISKDRQNNREPQVNKKYRKRKWKGKREKSTK